MFRVPLPDLPVQGDDGSGEDTAVDCSLITGPKVEWLPVVGVMWLHALAKCAVCYPQGVFCRRNQCPVHCTCAAVSPRYARYLAVY